MAPRPASISAEQAFLDDLGRQAVEVRLERVALVVAVEVDPALAELLVELSFEDVAEEAVDVLVVGEEDVAGVVEGESVLDDRPAEAAGPGVLLGQEEVGVVQVQRRAQAGRPAADDQVPGVGRLGRGLAAAFGSSARRAARRADRATSFLIASAVASQPRSAGPPSLGLGAAVVEPAEGLGRQLDEVVGVARPRRRGRRGRGPRRGRPSRRSACRRPCIRGSWSG